MVLSEKEAGGDLYCINAISVLITIYKNRHSQVNMLIHGPIDIVQVQIYLNGILVFHANLTPYIHKVFFYTVIASVLVCLNV